MNKFRILTVSAILFSSAIKPFAATGVAQIHSTSLTKNPVQIWADEIARSENSIQIAVYKLTSKSARNALIAAKKRGVKVDVIVDGETAQSDNSEVAGLSEAGIGVRLWPTEKLGELHVKMTVIDSSEVITGSFNLSEAAEEVNTEIITIDRRTETLADLEIIWRQLNESLDSAGVFKPGN